MAMPSSAITRQELGTTFNEFDLRMNQKNFIGARVLRPRVVGTANANVGKVPIEQLLQVHTTQRAPGAGYKRDTFTFTTFSYNCLEYGKEETLDDAQLAMYADIIDAETIHADRAGDAVLQEFERDVASLVFNTTTWTGATLTTAVTNEWDNFANATPVEDVQAAHQKVNESSGMDANAVIMNRRTWRNLTQCESVLDRIKFTQRTDPGTVRNMVADLLDVRYVLVAGGFKNTAITPTAASISSIWDNEYVMVCRIAETDDPQEPCVGRTFLFSGDGPGAPGDDSGVLALIMEEYREESKRGSVLRARNNRDIVIMYAEAGHMLSNIA